MRISELENKLKKHAQITKSIMQAPFDLNKEIKNMEAYAMNKPKTTVKRTIVLAAVIALCSITVTMTLSANSIKGFFGDILRFDGAVIGTQYENATNDIKVEVLESTAESRNSIPLSLTFEDPTEAPFPFIEEIVVSEYRILDSKSKEIVKTKLSAADGDKGAVCDGKVLVNLSIGSTNLEPDKEYTLVIEKMYGLSKADAPLHITGTWECKLFK